MIDFEKYTQFVDAVTSDESKTGGKFQDRLKDLYSKDCLLYTSDAADDP